MAVFLRRSDEHHNLLIQPRPWSSATAAPGRSPSTKSAVARAMLKEHPNITSGAGPLQDRIELLLVVPRSGGELAE
jgi:hypothetical protein